MSDRIRPQFSTLNPTQWAICAGTFILTAIGAIALAWVFTKWNGARHG